MVLKTISRPRTSRTRRTRITLVSWASPGGMRARAQPRKPSTQEVEAHMIDQYPFRSWCRYCVMAASRSDHHRRQAEDYNEVPVVSCDYGFLQTAEIMDRRSKIIHATVYAAKELRINCCVEQKGWRETQRSRCQNNAQHKPSIRQQISRTRRAWCQNCESESSQVDMFCT